MSSPLSSFGASGRMTGGRGRCREVVVKRFRPPARGRRSGGVPARPVPGERVFDNYRAGGAERIWVGQFSSVPDRGPAILAARTGSRGQKPAKTRHTRRCVSQESPIPPRSGKWHANCCYGNHCKHMITNGASGERSEARTHPHRPTAARRCPPSPEGEGDRRSSMLAASRFPLRSPSSPLLALRAPLLAIRATIALSRKPTT
jgi:hypothetical protein